MKKLLLTLIMSIVLGGTVFAQWYPQTEFYNPKGYDTYFNTAYPFDKGLYGNVDYPIAYLKCNDANITIDDRWDDFEVGAFVGDELRGFIFMTTEYCEDGYLPMFDNIFVYSNDDGEVVSFKVYDHATGTEYECTTNLTIVTGDDSNYYGVYDDPEGISDETLFISFTMGDLPEFHKPIVGYGDATDKSGYYLIASPVEVAPADVEGMTYEEGDDYDNFDLFSFDQAINGEEWRNYKVDQFNLLPGQGYLYANKADVTLTVTGNPVEDDNYQVTLHKAGDENAMAGVNLVGNPFGMKAYIDRASYTMNGEGYVLINAGSSIDVMQGVLVEAAEEGEQLNFTTEAPGKGSNLSLNVTSESKLVDRAIVNFGNGRNLSKITFSENDSKLYMTQDSRDFAVVYSEGQGEMPVCFKAQKNGTYNISFTAENAEFSYLHLIDNMTGIDVDLLENPSYSFDARTTDYASRFRLVFSAGNANMGDDFGFFSNGNLLILGIDGEATVQLIDVTGRILSSETFSGNYSKAVNEAQGVYMLRLIQGDNVRTQKIVVK